MDAWFTHRRSNTCLNLGVITDEIKSPWKHLGRSIAIQGAIFKRFYNAYQREIIQTVDPDPTATIIFETVHCGCFIVTVDRNDQTDTPKFPLNRLVLRRCMHPSWISIQLSCLDTILLASLDLNVFLTQFRMHGALEIEIWWRIEGEIAAWNSTRFFAINQVNHDDLIAKRV